MQENCHSNFVITGHGRSGTKFLSSLMNQSYEWTVLHEPGSHELNAPVNTVQPRFDRSNYGEVNSYLRRILWDLNVEKRGVIYRDPKEIWISVANRSDPQAWPQKIEKLKESMGIISHSVSKGAKLILFHKMINEKEYLQNILSFFGIGDVHVTDADLLSVNSTISKKYTSLDEFPQDIINEINNISCQWEVQ